MRAERLLLAGILVVGLGVRFFNLGAVKFSPDEVVYSVRSIGVFPWLRAGFIDHPPLYFNLVDLVYGVSGVSESAARTVSALAGALSVLLVYLLARRLFDGRTALFSSAVYALSYYDVYFARRAFIDQTAALFWLASVYYLLRGLWDDRKFLVLCAGFTGAALLTKYVSFLLPLILILIVSLERGFKGLGAGLRQTAAGVGDYVMLLRRYRYHVTAIVVVALALTPIVSYNLALHHMRGVLDLQLTAFFGTDDRFYSKLRTYDFGPNLAAVPGGVLGATKMFSGYHSIFFVVAALSGLFLMRREPAARVVYPWFWVVVLFYSINYSRDIAWGDVLKAIPVPGWYYVVLSPALSISGGYFLSGLADKWGVRLGLVAAALIIAGEVIMLPAELSHAPSLLGQVRGYVMEDTPPDAIVVMDTVVYDGYSSWITVGRTGFIYDDFRRASLIFSGGSNTSVYFIALMGDGNDSDGTGYKNPDSRRSANGTLIELFGGYEPLESFTDGSAEFGVYKTTMKLNSSIYDRTHQVFYFYPVGWDDPKYGFDNYVGDNTLESLVASILLIISKVITLAATLFALSTPYWLLKELAGSSAEDQIPNPT